MGVYQEVVELEPVDQGLESLVEPIAIVGSLAESVSPSGASPATTLASPIHAMSSRSTLRDT